MKICLLQVYHDALDKRMFHKVGRSLVGGGHLVVSICPEGDFADEERDGIFFRYIPRSMSLWGRFCAVGHLVRVGRREEADIYIAPEAESWVAALIIKFLRGGRVVYDMHEHVPTNFAAYFPGPLRRQVVALTRMAMRCFARYTDHIVLTRESFDPLWDGLNIARTTVINSNHLQAPCAHIPAHIREQLGPGPVIIHLGLFGEIRGSWQLLDAMKIVVRVVPTARCILLGSYESGSLETFKRAVSNAGLEDAILFVESVPFEEVPAWVAASDVGLILFQPGRLNHTLAMPHKLFDYMREGKPVIAPDFAVEIAHILDNAEGGVLVEVTDPAAIAHATIRLLEEPEIARRLGDNGRKAIEDRYHWEREETKLLAAIDTLKPA